LVDGSDMFVAMVDARAGFVASGMMSAAA